MATCPKCYEYLSDRHRCRPQPGRLMRAGVSLLVAAIVGGGAGALALGTMGAFIGVTGFEAVGLVAGTISAVIVQRFTRIPF